MAGSVWRVRDELWDVFHELLPEREPQKIGRPRVDDRTAFNAVMYVLVTLGVTCRGSSDTARRRPSAPAGMAA